MLLPEYTHMFYIWWILYDWNHRKCKGISEFVNYTFCGAHGSVVRGVRSGHVGVWPGTQRNWFKPCCSELMLCVVPFIYIVSVHIADIRLGLCLELTCSAFVSHPGGIKGSHLLSTTETVYKHWPYAPSWLGEGLNFLLFKPYIHREYLEE